MTDCDALLAAIAAECRKPDGGDDTVRLAYADFLDESGDHDRAEFIRVQCELATMPAYEGIKLELGWDDAGYSDHCKLAVKLKTRASELLRNHPEWSRVNCPGCNGEGKVHRPYPGGWDACRLCHATGDLFGVKPLSPTRRTVDFRRGFLDAVECVAADVWRECPDCTDGRWRNGRDGYCRTCDDARTVPTPWALAVARAVPTITRIAVTDRRPVQARTETVRLDEWRWFTHTYGTVLGEGDLPRVVFDCLEGGTLNEGNWCRFYRTEDAARDALAVGVCRWVRKQSESTRSDPPPAGSPPPG